MISLKPVTLVGASMGYPLELHPHSKSGSTGYCKLEQVAAVPC